MPNVEYHACEGPNSLVRVEALDDPGVGGARSKYQCYVKMHGQWQKSGAEIKLQKGPVQEPGLNGITNEALLGIVLDRLKSVQTGPCPCRETSLAVTKIEEALLWLHHRERDRLARKVKDTMEK